MDASRKKRAALRDENRALIDANRALIDANAKMTKDNVELRRALALKEQELAEIRADEEVRHFFPARNNPQQINCRASDCHLKVEETFFHL